MEPSAHTGLYAAPEQLHALLHGEDKPPVDALDKKSVLRKESMEQVEKGH